MMSSVVEACGSRTASASSSDSATLYDCQIFTFFHFEDLEEWHGYVQFTWAWKQTSVSQRVCKQRPQAICILQVFGVLTEACLASSHFFRTFSQCEAAQGKEPVKTGKRWTQPPQHSRKVSLISRRHPIPYVNSRKRTRCKYLLEFIFLSG